jgi:hypothetical protein
LGKENKDMNTKFKEESIVVINTWAETIEQNKLLHDCILNLSLLDVDICLVSHYPISTTVQNLVSYYVYDKNNKLFEKSNYEKWWWYYHPIKITLNNYLKSVYAHCPAVFSSIKHSLHLAKSANKKYVFYLESDTIINPKDLHSFCDIYDETLNSNKKAWFESYQYTKNNKEIDSVNGEFWFGEVDFLLENIDFSKTIWEYGLEYHLFNCLKDVKDKYILTIRDEKKPYKNKFPNSVINQVHSSPMYSKNINPKVKNFHLLGAVLLSEKEKSGLKPMLVLINHWDRNNKNQTFNNSMFSDIDNNFHILFFINDKLSLENKISLSNHNQSYWHQLPEIEDENTYRVEVNLYNEYTREWDWFYKKEWTSNDINEIKNEGNYEIE